MRPRSRLVAAAALVAAVVVLFLGDTAGAIPRPPGATPRLGPETEVTMAGIGPGQGVNGWLPPTAPPVSPPPAYPTTIPPGYVNTPEGFAGIIFAQPVGGGIALQMYCIDIRTPTWVGLGYELGDWTEATVPNVGWVARVLNSYYPTVPTAPTADNDSVRAAAVQAAVWYFSDGYVLDPTDPIRPITAQIVADVIAAGPLVQPPPPTLSIDPAAARGPIGGQAGPYTVTTSSAAGAIVTSDAVMRNATTGAVIPNATAVPSGTSILLESAAPGNFMLSAVALELVPTGNVYLYDGETPNVSSAQKLILAQQGVARVVASVTGQFFQVGSLTVTKTIAGPGAGQQSAVIIQVVCSGVLLQPVFTIPAGTTDSVSQTYSGIEIGTVCTITETEDGANAVVSVVVTPSGPVTIATETEAEVTNTYTFQPTTTTTTTTNTTTTIATTTTDPGGPIPQTGSGFPGIPMGLASVALGCVLLLIGWRMEDSAEGLATDS